MATSRSVTVAETINETPTPPKTYRIILKMSWKKFKDYFLSKEVVDTQKKIREERKLILRKIDKGEQISEEERKTLNSSFKQTLLTLFENLQAFLLNYLQLEESDNPQLQSFKLLAANDVTLWLKNLDIHISKTLEDILNPNLPGKEMISKAKKALNDLKQELKPENFSDVLSKPVIPEICADAASLNPSGKSASFDDANEDDSTEESIINQPKQSSTTEESSNFNETKQSDEEEGMWEYIFGDWFLL